MLEGSSFVEYCTGDALGGGGVCMSGSSSSIAMRDSRISFCSAAESNGGGLALARGTTASLADSTIEDCLSGGSGGGGVSMGPDSAIFVIRSELSRNMAPLGVGGGLAVHGGQVWLFSFFQERSNRFG